MRTLDGSVAEHLNRLLVGAIVVDEHELIVSKRACHVRYPGSQLPRSVAFEGRAVRRQVKLVLQEKEKQEKKETKPAKK